MNRLAVASIAGLIACHALPVSAQGRHPVTGAWQVTGLGREGRPWSLILEVTESELSGTVSSCGSNRALMPSQISSGRVTGKTFTFTCSNVDNSETVTFSGTVNG